MAWTYDKNLATPKDKVRFFVGDNLASQPLLDDEEISLILTNNNSNVYLASSEICEALSARFAREADISADVIKVDRKSQSERFAMLAVKYRRRGQNTTGIIFADDTATDKEAYFNKDLHLDTSGH